jgi:hypothetical protein
MRNGSVAEIMSFDEKRVLVRDLGLPSSARAIEPPRSLLRSATARDLLRAGRLLVASRGPESAPRGC